MGDITTVKLSKETKKELAKLGAKEETYNDIIRRLIQSYRKNPERLR